MLIVSRIHPIFLGGVNVGSGKAFNIIKSSFTYHLPGNKPPWTLPAKAAYGKFDGDRARKYHGVKEITTPSFFPILSLLVRLLLFLPLP